MIMSMEKIEKTPKMGEHFKSARKRAGLTQDDVLSELRKRFKISRTQGHISNLESPDREKLPSIENLIALAKIYGVSTDYLCGLTETELPMSDMEREGFRFNLGRELGDLYKSLTEVDRKRLVQFAHALAVTQMNQEEKQRDFQRALVEWLSKYIPEDQLENELEDLASEFPDFIGASVDVRSSASGFLD